jgi:hypothetical protein
MRTNSIFSVTAFAACLTLAACDGTTGPDDDEISAASAEEVAEIVVGLDASGGAAYGMTSDPRTGSQTFNRTATCPAGGTHSMEGSSTSSYNATTRVLSHSWSHTQTHDACAHIQRRGDREVTVVLDGTLTVTGSASYELPETAGQGRKILAYSSNRTGSTKTTIGDRTRTCEIDVSETYDPDTGLFTITGTVCGREVNLTHAPGQRVKR